MVITRYEQPTTATLIACWRLSMAARFVAIVASYTWASKAYSFFLLLQQLRADVINLPGKFLLGAE